jgi:hypothetical protein
LVSSFSHDHITAGVVYSHSGFFSRHPQPAVTFNHGRTADVQKLASLCHSLVRDLIRAVTMRG